MSPTPTFGLSNQLWIVVTDSFNIYPDMYSDISYDHVVDGSCATYPGQLSWHLFWHLFWHIFRHIFSHILQQIAGIQVAWQPSLAYLLTLILTVYLIYTLTMFDNFLTCILPCAFKAPGPMEERRGGGVSEPKPSDPHLTNVQNDGWFSIRMQKGYINSLKLLPLKFEGLETS